MYVYIFLIFFIYIYEAAIETLFFWEGGAGRKTENLTNWEEVTWQKEHGHGRSSCLIMCFSGSEGE